jgi:hypothetical protein
MSIRTIYRPGPTGNGVRWHWYHGLILYLLVQGISFGLSGLVSGIPGGKRKDACCSLSSPI